MEICIGIISYFPDSQLREKRIARCKELIKKCDEVFNLPILIIAQNWRGEVFSDNLKVRFYGQGLGITKARAELREDFLNSKYDYIILFDDDCILNGNRESGQRFLEFLKTNSGGYICLREKMFKLCAISKEIFRRFPIPDLSVEKKTGIEDLAFFMLLERFASEKRLVKYNWGILEEISDWSADSELSTWDRKDLNLLLTNTMDYLKNYKKGDK